MRIIIVDDHQIVREGLKTILQDDPDFEDKVQLIKERWQQAVTGTAGHLDYPASC